MSSDNFMDDGLECRGSSSQPKHNSFLSNIEWRRAVKHFGDKPSHQATKHKNLWGMFLESFKLLFSFFKIPFQVLCNFILRRPITCTLLSAVILVLISFII